LPCQCAKGHYRCEPPGELTIDIKIVVRTLLCRYASGRSAIHLQWMPFVKQFHDWAVWGPEDPRIPPEARRWVKGTLRLAELDIVDDEALARIVALTKEA